MPLKKDYRLAWWRRWITRPLMRGILRILFSTLTPLKITGREHIPLHKAPGTKAAYIVAINHVSLYEAPLVGAFWPEQLEAIGASDVWKRPGQGILAVLWGGIQIHRGDFDRSALESVLGTLRSGYPLLIAPEGGRSHRPGLRQARPGIAYIAEEAGLPVLPVGIVGTTDDFLQKAFTGKRPAVEMHIGRPILLPRAEGKGEERRKSRQRNADLVMRHIAGLLPEEYRGVYADSAIFME